MSYYVRDECAAPVRARDNSEHRSTVPSGFTHRLPDRCKFCDALGTVTIEMTIVRGVTKRTWCCRGCRREWPLSARELKAFERHFVSSDRTPAARRRRSTPH